MKYIFKQVNAIENESICIFSEIVEDPRMGIGRDTKELVKTNENAKVDNKLIANVYFTVKIILGEI